MKMQWTGFALLLACDGAPPELRPDGGADGYVAPIEAGADAGADVGPPDGGPLGTQPLVVRACPGSPECPSGEDVGIRAGATNRPIAPTAFETMLVDVDGDGRYEPDEGDTFEDLDGDGTFDGVWMAGFGNARPAAAVHGENPPLANALCLENGDTRLAIVVVDVVGLFSDEVELIREEVRELDATLDYVLVAATHDHEAPDTVGVWGESVGRTGYDEDYMGYLRAQSARVVADACDALEDANVENASFFLRSVDVSSDDGIQLDVQRYVGDLRDPFILDDQVRVLRFVSQDGMRTISTLVNFAMHAEYEGASNSVISADVVGWLRLAVENGVLGPAGVMKPGVGGTAVFINGALGVQIGPNHIRPATWDGEPTPEANRRARVVGEQLGYHVLTALDTPTETVDSVPVGFRAAHLLVPVDNGRYHLAFAAGLFGRRALYEFDELRGLRPGNVPHLRTEIAVLDIGRAQMIATPGELDPILFVGVDNDRAFTPPGVDVVDLSRPNPPDLSLAPRSGHLLEHAREDARTADDVWLLGCANDFLGYFIPPWDWQLAARPYWEEAEGAHYEETNALAPTTWPEIERLTRELLAWEAP